MPTLRCLQVLSWPLKNRQSSAFRCGHRPVASHGAAAACPPGEKQMRVEGMAEIDPNRYERRG
jgi:hypothetical protein